MRGQVEAESTYYAQRLHDQGCVPAFVLVFRRTIYPSSSFSKKSSKSPCQESIIHGTTHHAGVRGLLHTSMWFCNLVAVNI